MPQRAKAQRGHIAYLCVFCFFIRENLDFLYNFKIFLKKFKKSLHFLKILLSYGIERINWDLAVSLKKLVFVNEGLPPSASHPPPWRREAYVRFTFESSHTVKIVIFCKV